MLRFIFAIFGKEYEPCKSCEILKKQLEFEREERSRLLDATLSIVRPSPMPVANVASPRKVIGGVRLASHRIKEKEREDAETAAKIRKVEEEIADADKLLGVENESDDPNGNEAEEQKAV